jgi:L-lactate dehydrogenase complex protein LldF
MSSPSLEPVVTGTGARAVHRSARARPPTASPPTRPRKPLPIFPRTARAALGDTQLRRNMGRATQTIRAKRAAVVGELPDWEALREAGRAIKADVLAHLDTYLLQLEASVQAAGGQVHWARDAAEANAIVVRLVESAGARQVVKVKSLTTDEIRLNEALGAVGIEAIETDLAELIIQLAGERSSHILVPAIHKNRSEIRELFQRTIAQGQPLSDEPKALTAAARAHLRRAFLAAEVAISGVNFAVAETGTVGVVESEGNGRMCLTLPRVLISVMGIEKVLPRFEDLAVFLQLLPRSSTGERMNPYTSLWTGVTPGDGPQNFHLVLLDNGRTRVLADEVGRQTLQCIRCSACLNICPVYERTGGHAYSSVYPGPIGAILTPQLLGVERAATLPYASTLCGACYEVCPVKIDIPAVLLHLRGEAVRSGSHLAHAVNPEHVAMQLLARVFATPQRYERAQRLGRLGQVLVTHHGVIDRLPGMLGGWTSLRDLDPLPRQSFRDWWRAEHAAERGAAPTAQPADQV